MPYTMTVPAANPNTGLSPFTGTITFDCRSLTGADTLDVVYSSNDVTLNGAASQNRSHAISAVATTIADAVEIAGASGIWQITVTASVGGTDQRVYHVDVNIT